MLVIFSCAPPLLNVGSGKLGTPFWRMQAEYFKAFACCAALTVPPLTASGLQRLARLLRGHELRRRGIEIGARAGPQLERVANRIGEIGHPVRTHARE